MEKDLGLRFGCGIVIVYDMEATMGPGFRDCKHQGDPLNPKP